jgi:hypothetical protein
MARGGWLVAQGTRALCHAPPAFAISHSPSAATA